LCETSRNKARSESKRHPYAQKRKTVRFGHFSNMKRNRFAVKFDLTSEH
jgi:hypothetical protein